jgi:hypothetical protein
MQNTKTTAPKGPKKKQKVMPNAPTSTFSKVSFQPISLKERDRLSIVEQLCAHEKVGLIFKDKNGKLGNFAQKVSDTLNRVGGIRATAHLKVNNRDVAYTKDVLPTVKTLLAMADKGLIQTFITVKGDSASINPDVYELIHSRLREAVLTDLTRLNLTFK